VLLQILQRCVRMDLQELYQKGFAPINLNEHLYEKSSPNKKGDPQFWTCWFPHRSKLINVTSCTSLMLTLHFLNPKWNYGQLSQVKSRSIVIIFGYSWVFHEPLHHMIIGRLSKGSLRISDPGLGQSRPGAAFHLALGDVAKSPVDRGFRNPQSHHSSWLSWTMKVRHFICYIFKCFSMTLCFHHDISYYPLLQNPKKHQRTWDAALAAEPLELTSFTVTWGGTPEDRASGGTPVKPTKNGWKLWSNSTNMVKYGQWSNMANCW
jgi:hypothetical protein